MNPVKPLDGNLRQGEGQETAEISWFCVRTLSGRHPEVSAVMQVISRELRLHC